MQGTATGRYSQTLTANGQQSNVKQSFTGNWTATRIVPSTGGISGAWAITNSNCTATGGLSCTSGTNLSSMFIQQQGNTLTVDIAGVGPATGTVSGQTITITASATYASTPVCHYALHMMGTMVASNRMGGSYSSACADDSGQVFATVTADWTATRTGA
jgi:hypothetical protein